MPRSRRKQTMELLAEGFAGAKPEQVFGQGFGLAAPGSAPAPETPGLAELRAKAERAQPKPTEKNRLYANFGRRREDAAPPTPAQVASAQARREAAARHQEVRACFGRPHPVPVTSALLRSLLAMVVLSATSALLSSLLMASPSATPALLFSVSIMMTCQSREYYQRGT
jgi:hypothetical protein